MAAQDQALGARSRIEDQHLVSDAHRQAGAIWLNAKEVTWGRRMREPEAERLARHIPDLQIVRDDPLTGRIEDHPVSARREESRGPPRGRQSQMMMALFSPKTAMRPRGPNRAASPLMSGSSS